MDIIRQEPFYAEDLEDQLWPWIAQSPSVLFSPSPAPSYFPEVPTPSVPSSSTIVMSDRLHTIHTIHKDPRSHTSPHESTPPTPIQCYTSAIDASAPIPARRVEPSDLERKGRGGEEGRGRKCKERQRTLLSSLVNPAPLFNYHQPSS